MWKLARPYLRGVRQQGVDLRTVKTFPFDKRLCQVVDLLPTFRYDAERTFVLTAQDFRNFYP